MLAIHDSASGFHPYWLEYCRRKNISFRLVNCHETNIIEQLRGCTGLMWHHSHTSPRDMLVARQILFALEHAGVRVFPDFRTGWHFDDKVGQKYLFEALDLPAVPSWVFTKKSDALDWIDKATFPKVFKLRKGAGSTNVRLVRTKRQARSLVRQVFGRGFSTYSAWGSLKERLYKYRIGQAGPKEILKGLVRFAIPPNFASVVGKERGYVYFQEFIPENDSDIRVIVIGDKAFAIKRMIRPGDFRASGSGKIIHHAEEIDIACIETAFTINEKVQSDCLACDFVLNENGKPLLIEISYGFSQVGYDQCPGYWNKSLEFIGGPFSPQGWMVDQLIR